MTLAKHIRTLTGAALLALTVLSVTGEHVHAKPKRPVDDGIRCAIFNEKSGEWEFYLPGEVITVMIAGFDQRLRCGADGEWTVVVRPMPSAPRPAGSPAQS
jgi:hypothetical protein